MSVRATDEHSGGSAAHDASADLAAGLRAGGWDYAGMGAARAVDPSAELAATRTRAEARAWSPHGGQQAAGRDASPAAGAGYAPATYPAGATPEADVDPLPGQTGDAAQEAQAASAAREVSGAASVVHAVDAASGARAAEATAATLGSAAATSAVGVDAGAAAVATVGRLRASDALSKASGPASAATSAIESGLRAKTAGRLVSRGGKALGVAAELSGGDDVGEGMGNAACGESRAYLERKASRELAKRFGRARAARAARKAAKAAGGAGSVVPAGTAPAAKTASARAAESRLGAAASSGRGGIVRRTGSMVVARVKSLFKPLPPLKFAAEKMLAAMMSAIPALAPIVVVLLGAAVAVCVAGFIVALGGGDESQNQGSLQGNEATIAAFLHERGVDNEHIAAILANIWHESRCDPTANQVFDFGTIDRMDRTNNHGHGLSQWGNPDRFDALVHYAELSRGDDRWEDINVQLNYLWYELTGEDLDDGKVAQSGAGWQSGFFSWSHFNSLGVDEATEYYRAYFERGGSAAEDRPAKAREYLAKLQSSGSYAGGSGVVDAALSKLGAPYVWSAAGPDEFDCSGLCCWAYAQAGHDVGRLTTDGFWGICTIIDESEAQPGDIVFMNHGTSPGYEWGHVGIWMGNNQVVHTATVGIGVTVDPLHGSWLEANGYAFGRVP